MPTSQNSETPNTSNDDDTTKNFVDDYIKNLNSYLGDFLKTSQPTYDPNDTSIKDSSKSSTNTKITTTTTTTNSQETQTTTKKSSSSPISLTELLKSPTVNPDIFSNRPFKDDNNNNESLSSSLSSPSQKETNQSLAQKLKISEISGDYFNQKKEIWNGALINCSELHIKLQECMTFGGLFDKASLCIKARRKFWSCMEDQKVSKKFILFNK
jgi:hypothetical protein